MSAVRSVLRDAAVQLGENSQTPRLDAELLMAHALGVSRSDLLLRRLGDRAPPEFVDFVARRLSREPVAYITGTQEFYGRTFLVTRDVLIPRGDSETIIDAALPFASGAARVLDLGTGSGALLLTILAERSNATGLGIDASLAALEVAEANARKLGLSKRALMTRHDWTQPDWRKGLGKFDLILANPPYVETGARLSPDVCDWEPGAALFAGPDGLADYRILIPQLPDLLTSGGAAVLEIGAGQADAVAQISGDAGFETTGKRDMGRHERALVLRRKP